MAEMITTDELRDIATKAAFTADEWPTAEQLRRGWVFSQEEADYIAALPPRVVLDVLAAVFD